MEDRPGPRRTGRRSVSLSVGAVDLSILFLFLNAFFVSCFLMGTRDKDVACCGLVCGQACCSCSRCTVRATCDEAHLHGSQLARHFQPQVTSRPSHHSLTPRKCVYRSCSLQERDPAMPPVTPPRTHRSTARPSARRPQPEPSTGQHTDMQAAATPLAPLAARVSMVPDAPWQQLQQQPYGCPAIRAGLRARHPCLSLPSPSSSPSADGS